MLVAAALLVALAAKHHYAWALLAAITCADLLAVAAGLNPTLPVDRLTPPAWFAAASSRAERLYIGGRVRGYMNAGDPDAVSTWHIPAESTAVAGRMELNAELPMAPSGWRVREALSYDLPYLWPAEYEQTVRRFERASRAERDAFLRRTGVRWCVVNDAQQRPWRAVAAVPDWNMRVYECHPDASRLAFAAAPGTLEDLFTPDRADGEDAGEAQIVDDAPNRVVVAATVHRDTYLVLRDSFDPSWRAEVDGQPAPIVRAFGIQRAVALAAGRHLVRFVYRPRELFIGLTLSVMGIIGLAVAGRAGWPRPLVRRRDDGFTLIELMIVLAIIGIVLAIAFTEYRNMQARGNEASALSSMRSIAAAQWQFATTCGHMKYAATLPALAQPVPSTGEAFLSPDLTSGETIEKSGYVIRMTGKPLDDAPPACNGAPVAAGYAATADPVKPGVSGAWFYAVNADRVLYLDQEKSFEEDLPESGAPPHGAEVK
jgi:prepilin-type N-terminal cleavage/methylation domain-containing protein